MDSSRQLLWSDAETSIYTTAVADVTTSHDNETDWHITLPEVRYITLVSYTLAFVLGLTGNSLVIYVITRFSVVRRKSVANYYIGNLAIADELYILSLPLFIWATYERRWPLDGHTGNIACKFAYLGRDISKFASVLTLVALSVDRCIASYSDCSHLRTIRVGKVISVCIWIICAVISTPYLMYAGTIQVANTTRCRLNGPFSTAGSAMYLWTMFQFLFGLFLPFVAIAVAYATLFLRLRLISRRHGSAVTRPNRKMVITVLVIVVIFVLSQTPYHAMQFVALNRAKTVDQYALIGERYLPSNDVIATVIYLNLFTQILAFVSSCSNPVIYGLLNDNFRRLFSTVCSCGCKSHCKKMLRAGRMNNEPNLANKSRANVRTHPKKLQFEISFHIPYAQLCGQRRHQHAPPPVPPPSFPLNGIEMETTHYNMTTVTGGGSYVCHAGLVLSSTNDETAQAPQ